MVNYGNIAIIVYIGSYLRYIRKYIYRYIKMADVI